LYPFSPHIQALHITIPTFFLIFMIRSLRSTNLTFITSTEQVNAAVQTNSSEAIDRFVVKSRSGSVDLEEIRNAVLTHAVNSWSIPGQGRPAAADEATSVADPSATVEVAQAEHSADTVVVKVSCSDRPGVLGAMTSTLESLALTVISAEINTLSDGRVDNTFTCKRAVNQTEDTIRDKILKELQ
jgi:UTP:GlnB (protein PII) uridylyltransferase